MVLLPDTSIDAAGKLAQEITDMVAKVQAISAGPVTISCGVGELQKSEDGNLWLERCDHALYEAKRRGRGRIWLAPDVLPADAGNGIREKDAPLYNAAS